MREWSSSMKPRWLLPIPTAVVIAAAGVYVIRKHAAPASPTTTAAPSSRPSEFSLPATLQAAITIPVPVPIEGKIETFQVEVGADVYEGQLLARIHSEALEAV